MLYFVPSVKSFNATVTMSYKCPHIMVLVYSAQAIPVVNSVSQAPVKTPAHSSPPKKVSWTASREAASLWSGDIDGKML